MWTWLLLAASHSPFAIEREDQIWFLRNKLEVACLTSYCGEVQQVRNAVELFWEKMDNYCNLLDLLVLQGGLFKHPVSEGRMGRNYSERTYLDQKFKQRNTCMRLWRLILLQQSHVR
jgi:hypothetical protein